MGSASTVLPDGVATAMVEEMAAGGLGKSLVFSGGRLLTVADIAETAVGLIGSGRVLRTVPGWRGAVMRSSAVVPSLAGKGIGLFAAQGRRAQRDS